MRGSAIARTSVALALVLLSVVCSREVTDVLLDEETMTSAGSGAADSDTGIAIIVEPSDGSRPVDGQGEPGDGQEPDRPHFDAMPLLGQLVHAYEERNLQIFDELLSEEYVFIPARDGGAVFPDCAELKWDKATEISVHANLFDPGYLPSTGLPAVDRISCQIVLIDCVPYGMPAEEEWRVDCKGDWVLWSLPHAGKPFAVRHSCEFSLLVGSGPMDSDVPTIRIWREETGTVRFLYSR